jgi:hypothetical protein
MNLDAVAFPALIVADDGWVDYASLAASLGTWTVSAIRKYGKRRVVICDSRDRAWLVETISPHEGRNPLSRSVDLIRNRKLAVTIQVHAITEHPMETVREMLLRAIETDDDILTQYTDASELTSAIRSADSFDAFMRVLTAAKAVELRRDLH